MAPWRIATKQLESQYTRKTTSYLFLIIIILNLERTQSTAWQNKEQHRTTTMEVAINNIYISTASLWMNLYILEFAHTSMNKSI